MIHKSAHATLKLPVDGAPEVKGTVAYIIPHVVEWRVGALNVSGRLHTWTRAVLTGPSRKGRWAGAVIYNGGDVPEWLPIPYEWIEGAKGLVAAAIREAGNSGEGGE